MSSKCMRVFADSAAERGGNISAMFENHVIQQFLKLTRFQIVASGLYCVRKSLKGRSGATLADRELARAGEVERGLYNLVGSAVEQKPNSSKGLEDFEMKSKSRIWP